MCNYPWFSYLVFLSLLCPVSCWAEPEQSRVRPAEAEEAEAEENEERIKELESIALQVFDGIVARDVLVVLELIDRTRGIGWGADGSRSYVDIEQDLTSGSGELYCSLFGCAGYPKSVRDYFVDVNLQELSIQVRLNETPADYESIVFADVIYEWPGKPRDLWVVDLPNPSFGWRDEGWKFETVFTE